MAIDAARVGDCEEFFAKFFVFGSNGGGEFIAFDMRADVPACCRHRYDEY